MRSKIELIPNKMFKKDEVVFNEGDAADGMYYICSGKVEIASINNGKKTVLAHMREGEIFGEMALVDNQPRSATVTALENTWVYTFRINHMQEKIKNLDPMMHSIMTILVATIRHLNDRLAKVESNP